MATSVGTGFRRVAVVAPDSRIDVALPENIPVSDVYPQILRLTGQTQPADAPTGYYLFRGDGTALDSSRTLADQRVVDGEMLHLRPFAQSLPPTVFDDVCDAVASAVTRDRRLWNDGMLRGAGLAGVGVLLTLLAFVLWSADPVRHDMHGLPGVIAATAGLLLAALAGVRARVYRDQPSAVALGLGSLPIVLCAGSGIVGPDSGQGAGRLQFLLGCVAVLVVSVALVVLSAQGDAPFIAATFVAAICTLAAFLAIVTEATATQAAGVCVPVAIGLMAFLPGLSTRLARLPIGYVTPRSLAERDAETDPRGRDVPGSNTGPDAGPEAVDEQRIAAQARRGHELLFGLLGGCCAVVVGAAAVLGFSASAWAQLLSLAAGLTTLLRARLFRYTAQVVCTLVAGLAALALLVLGMAVNPPTGALTDFLAGDRAATDLRTLWLSLALVGGAALLTFIALTVPKRGLTPFWGRALDITDGLLLLSLMPLCLAVLDLYSRARSMTSG
ncbi:type VII secretion integral membrane protein EccD [Streptomyces sp. MST-110588]|uniref:type VII secretion integral membrane protein EccD n=1 Tax=Streptomyces sp. MST-110588 TaxID=2833628 RepID=UPI001F5DDCED|nr:type VII secretion integral membrane protein EccD [Streptomyces sp. MST-110588]UNO41068.1 type VII secretion integral membrane protein EccD [Streptomyces sp. MST-110588]